MDGDWQVHLYGASTVRIGSAGNPWNHPDLRAPFWRLYCNDGDGPYLLLTPTGEGFPLCAGAVYLIPTGVAFGSRAPCEVGHFFVHFDVLGIPPVARQALFPRPLRVPDSPRLSDSVSALRGMHYGAQRDAASTVPLRLRLTALIYEALASVLAAIPDTDRARWLPVSAEAGAVRPALDFIAGHLAERLSVTQLAALCYLSEDYFIRRFRECMGQTPTQYIREQRVAEAARRLAFTDHSIDRIAEETGFGSRHYFTRVFQQHVGRTPAAYRNTPPV